MPLLTKKFIGRGEKYAVDFKTEAQLKARLINHIFVADLEDMMAVVNAECCGVIPKFEEMTCQQLVVFLCEIDETEQYEIFI